MRTELEPFGINIHIRKSSELYGLVPRAMRPPVTKGMAGVGPYDNGHRVVIIKFGL